MPIEVTTRYVCDGCGEDLPPGQPTSAVVGVVHVIPTRTTYTSLAFHNAAYEEKKRGHIEVHLRWSDAGQDVLCRRCFQAAALELCRRLERQIQRDAPWAQQVLA